MSLYENESVKDFIQDPIGFAPEFELYGQRIKDGENSQLDLGF